jgi:hypothetical protein
MISLSISDLEKTSKDRPVGYKEHVLSLGKEMDGRVWLKPEDYLYLAKYYREGAPPEPKLSDSIDNLFQAIGRWSKSGFAVASSETIEKRKEACEACPYWDSSARLGLGICKHAKCGCTKLKWWLQTETCPDNRWPEQ